MLENLSEQDRSDIKDALLAWKEEGVDRPVVPIFQDTDNDEVLDFIGLDENNELIIVSGITLDESVFESLGEFEEEDEVEE
jgi:hypothetical protein